MVLPDVPDELARVVPLPELEPVAETPEAGPPRLPNESATADAVVEVPLPVLELDEVPEEPDAVDEAPPDAVGEAVVEPEAVGVEGLVPLVPPPEAAAILLSCVAADPNSPCTDLQSAGEIEE